MEEHSLKESHTGLTDAEKKIVTVTMFKAILQKIQIMTWLKYFKNDYKSASLSLCVFNIEG